MHKQHLLLLLPKANFCACIIFIQMWLRGSTQAFPQLDIPCTSNPDHLSENHGYAPAVCCTINLKTLWRKHTKGLKIHVTCTFNLVQYITLCYLFTYVQLLRRVYILNYTSCSHRTGLATCLLYSSFIKFNMHSPLGMKSSCFTTLSSALYKQLYCP